MRSKLCLIIFSLMLTVASVNAQRAKKPTAAKPLPAIFAVVSGGKSIQPIAGIDKGVLKEFDATGDKQKTFAANYYKPKSTYSLIFGGSSSGTVSVSKANYPGECAGNSAESVTTSTTAKLNESVMALATNAAGKLPATSYRRRPTAAEKAEIDKLVRDEFVKEKVSATAVKTLHYQNLTALDVDADGVPEFVGSYWVGPSDKERDLLYFIATKSTGSDYVLAYKTFTKIKPDDVMSGEMSDVDKGYGHELLLDALDYDGDGTAEIFTIGKAFEGDNFYVYKRSGKDWKRVFETYNYRCAF